MKSTLERSAEKEEKHSQKIRRRGKAATHPKAKTTVHHK
jgi:hypothetical protein